jgi:hypothetical protein
VFWLDYYWGAFLITYPMELTHDWVFICVDCEHRETHYHFSCSRFNPFIPYASDAKRVGICGLNAPAYSLASFIVGFVEVIG